MLINAPQITIINIILIISFLYIIIQGFSNGFLATLIRLISDIFFIVIAWSLAQVLSQQFFLITILKNDFLNNIPNLILNQVLWFIVIFVVLKIMIFIVLKISKKINDIKVIGSINKILGGLLGICLTIIYTMVIISILRLGFIKNYQDVEKQTILSFYHQPIQVLQEANDQYFHLDHYLEQIRKQIYE